MKRRFVDLSIYLENDVISDPPPFGPKIQYFRHEDTAAQIAGFFPGLKKEDFRTARAGRSRASIFRLTMAPTSTRRTITIRR